MRARISSRPSRNVDAPTGGARHKVNRLLAGALGLVMATGLGAVVGATATAVAAPSAASAASSVNGPISRKEVMDRAEFWADLGQPYSQTTWSGDPQGKSYRNDCSGLVSMAWHVDGSFTTGTFPGSGLASPLGSLHDLKPGDAIHKDGHMELFAFWKNERNHSEGAYVYSFNKDGEPVRSPNEENRKGNIGYNSWSDMSTYRAWRYNKIVDDYRPFDSFTGDAKTDLVIHNGTDVGVRKGTGSGFSDLGVVTSGWGRFHGMKVANGMGRLFYGDFNGDHYTDMIVHSGTDVSVRLNNKSNAFGGGTVVSSGWGRFHGMDVADGLGRLYFADYNADGYTDMVVHHGTEVWVRLNTTNGGFDGGRLVSSGWGRFHGMNVPNGMGRLYFADYNADGFDDMIVHSGTDVSVRLNNNAKGFTPAGTVSSGWGRFHGMDVTDGLGRLYFADYDGDGFDDMVVHQGTDVFVRLNNTASGFDGGRLVTSGWGRFHGMQVTNGLGRLYFA
ncbi:VCBS repeat protein [Actinoplanes xinjiangensis]|uniref:VCBS repeat protein n=1 Tax=Actinoplanes xinjiangensis TaxID=512350 RepID=A0A316FMN7_9ACTN|nr:VCBS repeat protein [Actinoplanes xinjiangensis]